MKRSERRWIRFWRSQTMRRLFFGTLPALLLVAPGTAWAQPVAGVPVKSMKLTVLSTMLVGKNPSGGMGEWGFAGLLEVDGRRLLIDTGGRAETVLHNAE